MLENPLCKRCNSPTSYIGFHTIKPWGHHKTAQATSYYQCGTCGQYLQTGFDDNDTWTGERLEERKIIRIFSDPFLHTGTLYLSPTGRMNLDGYEFQAGEPFELFDVELGAYISGSIEADSAGDWYFTPDGIYLIDGMKARRRDDRSRFRLPY